MLIMETSGFFAVQGIPNLYGFTRSQNYQSTWFYQ